MLIWGVFLRRLLVLLFAQVAVTPLPAAAMDASGFYAGIYAVGGARNSSGYEEAQVAGFAQDPGAEPTAVPENPGFPALTFDIFSDVLTRYPNATVVGYAAGGAQGTVTSGHGLGAGVVVGYALGNGMRFEADLSTMTFSASSAEIARTTFTNGIAELVGGEWNWTNLLEDETPFTGTFDLSELPYGGRLLTSSTFFLLNGSFDLTAVGPVTPYVGGGLGMALISLHSQGDSGLVDGYTLSEAAVVPAAQLGLGFRVPVGEQFTLDVGYRYKVAEYSDLTAAFVVPDRNDEDDSFDSFVYRQDGLIGIHALQAGIIFSFD